MAQDLPRRTSYLGGRIALEDKLLYSTNSPVGEPTLEETTLLQALLFVCSPAGLHKPLVRYPNLASHRIEDSDDDANDDDDNTHHDLQQHLRQPQRPRQQYQRFLTKPP